MLTTLSAVARACQTVPISVAEFPWDGAVDVPTDVVPTVVFAGGTGTPVVFDEGTGAPIEAAVEGVLPWTLRVVPAAPLLAGHTYRLDVEWNTVGASLPVWFTVGEDPDDVAPGADTIVAVTGGLVQRGSCGWELYLHADIVATEGTDPLLHEIQISPTEDFSAPTAVPSPRAIGWGYGSDTVDWLEPGQEVWLRSRAIDLAGNVGPWSATFNLSDVPGAHSGDTGGPSAAVDSGVRSARARCGCGGADPGAAVSVAVAATLLRRRPRRRRTT